MTANSIGYTFSHSDTNSAVLRETACERKFIKNLPIYGEKATINAALRSTAALRKNISVLVRGVYLDASQPPFQRNDRVKAARFRIFFCLNTHLDALLWHKVTQHHARFAEKSFCSSDKIEIADVVSYSAGGLEDSKFSLRVRCSKDVRCHSRNSSVQSQIPMRDVEFKAGSPVERNRILIKIHSLTKFH